MGPLDLIRHPLIFTGITLPEFILWYFWHQPRRIIRSYNAYRRAFVEMFSFLFLLRTLISPWRQITDTYQKRGFSLSLFSQTLTLNVLSRTIGFLFRIVTLILGIFFLLLLTACFALYFVVWLVFPVLFWIGVTYISRPLF